VLFSIINCSEANVLNRRACEQVQLRFSSVRLYTIIAKAEIPQSKANSMKPTGSENSLSQAEFQRVFSELYRPIRNFIYYRCGDSDLADDLAQDSFIKLWESRDRVERSTMKAYLYKIAQNQTINYQKRQQLFYRFQKQGTNDRDYDTPEKIAEMNEYEARLQAVIAALPDGGREVFLMNRLEDLTYQEIANRLGLSVKAIEKRMSKVLQIFRDKLGIEI